MPTFANLVNLAKKKLTFFIQEQLENPSIAWLIITTPLKLLFYFIILLRSFKKRHKVPMTCSLCVGNITLGGNGKTPFILKLIEDLMLFNPAVISKGYKRKQKGTFSLKNCQEIDLVGDEPLLIHSKFPKVDGFVTDSRYHFLEKEKPTFSIFDDGLQDSKLDYDFKIALFDKIRFSKPQNLLPQGNFREPIASLKKVDLIGIKGPIKLDEFLQIKCELLKKKIKTPVMSFFLSPIGFKPLNEKKFDINKKSALFCGIGNPKSFQQTLSNMKIIIDDQLILPDHETLKPSEMENWINQLKQKQISQIICTEKDAIKLSSLENLSIALFSLETETILEHGIQEYQHFIEKLKRNIITTVKERDQSNG